MVKASDPSLAGWLESVVGPGTINWGAGISPCEVFSTGARCEGAGRGKDDDSSYRYLHMYIHVIGE